MWSSFLPVCYTFIINFLASEFQHLIINIQQKRKSISLFPHRKSFSAISFLNCFCFSELTTSFIEDLMRSHRALHSPWIFISFLVVLTLFPSASVRILEEAALVAHDTIVCGFLKPNMEWSLCVWRGWGSHELEVFHKSYEELGRLETDMRKRRELLSQL